MALGKEGKKPKRGEKGARERGGVDAHELVAW